MESDIFFLQKAIEIAGKGRPSPNPFVGCVIVKNNKIIGEGFHRKAGDKHAEIEALDDAKEKGNSVEGSALYVSLEPCCHYGRTPPCTERIIRSGIKKVVCAMQDPNPLVDSKGIKILIKAGIDAKVIRLEEAERLNEAYIKYITKNMPFVLIKSAASIDGRIATREGDSKWISSAKSRAFAHRLRDRYDAVMVGIGTVLNDDPQLTCRLKGGKDPLRVILDSSLRIGESANVLSDNNAIIFTTGKADKDKKDMLEKKGIRIFETSSDNGKVNIKEALEALAKMHISSVLAEGGGSVNASLLENNLADKVCFIIAPKIIGGKDAVCAVMGRGAESVSDAWEVHGITLKKIEKDMIIEGYLR